MQKVTAELDRREEEISKVQTALWMAEKLARLCRETIRARDAENYAEVERLAREIESLASSSGFAAAVEAVSMEYFYPNVLRDMLEMLENGAADTINEAVRMMG